MKKLLESGQTAPAEQMVRELLVQDPNDAETVNLLGELRVREGRVEEARQAFQRAVALKGGFAPALENLTVVDLMLHLNTEAAKMAQQLLMADAANYNARLVLGTTALNANLPRKAISQFQLLYQSDQRDPFSLAGLAECYRKLGIADQAEKYQNILQSVQIDPKDALLASQLFTGGTLHPYVLPWLDAAHRSTPTDYSLTMALAEARLEGGDYVRAHDCLEQAQAAHGNDALLLVKLSSIEQKLGRNDESLKHLYEAKRYLREDATLLVLYATICMQRRMFPEARAALETAERSAPDSANLHYLLGVAYFSLGDPKAEAEFTQSAEINPESASALAALGAYYLSNGLVDKAMSVLSRAVQIDPAQPSAYYYLGQCYRKAERTEDATKVLRKASELAPLDGRPHAELGILFMEQEKPKQAEAELRRAVALDPSLATAHYRLGTLLRRSGHTREAGQAFHLAEQLRDTENRNAVMELVPQRLLPSH